jgi:sugar lactone lactonase YvrE
MAIRNLCPTNFGGLPRTSPFTDRMMKTTHIHHLTLVTLLAGIVASVLPPGSFAQGIPQDHWYLEKAVNRPDMTGLLAPRGIAVSENGEIYVAEKNNHRISVWDGNGTFLRAWGSNGANDGQFKQPLGIAAFEGEVYVNEWESHRIQVFDENGTFLRKWGGYGSADGQFKNPWGIAVDRDANGTQVYVTDYNGHRVQVFDENGTLIRKWGSYGGGDNQLSSPAGIAIGQDGLVYLNSRNHHKVKVFQKNGNYVRSFITTKDNGAFAYYPYGLSFTGNRLAISHAHHSDHRIRIYETNGSFVTAIGMETNGNALSQFDEPYCIAADSAGNILVSDGKNHRIQVFDSNGAYLRKIGFLGSQYFDPTGLLLDEAGNHYVADGQGHRILKWDENATPLGIIATSGSVEGYVREPRQMAFGPTGRIYAVERDNNRVSVFERNGTFVRSFGSNLDKPEGVTVSPQGEVYVADTNNHRIQVFDLNGSFRRVFGEQGDIDGRFDRPMGLGFNASGELLVADFGNSRIQVIDATGTFLWKSNHNAFGGLRSLSLSRDGLILLGGRYRLRILDNRGHLIHEIERQAPSYHDPENFTPVAFAPDGSFRYFHGNDVIRHYKRTYRTLRPIPSKEMALPEIVSVAQRAGTHYLDVSYRIHDLDSPQASARLLAFVDGGNDLDSVIVPKTFVGGVTGKLDDNVSTGQIHTVTWNAGTDWNASFGEVEMEILAKDENNLLNLHFLNLPGTDSNATQLKISRSPVTDADLLDLWFWLLASGSNDLNVTDNGYINGPNPNFSALTNPATLPDLLLWVDATDVDGNGQVDTETNGSKIASWSDKSGNNRHIVQSEADRQPTYLSDGGNGKPVLSFDQDVLSATGVNIDAKHIVVVTRHRQVDSGWAALVSRGGDRGQIRRNGSNPEFYEIHPHSLSYNGIHRTNGLPRSEIPFGEYHVVSVQLSNDPNNISHHAGNYENFYLGADGGGDWWPGEVCEALIFGSPLSETDETRLGIYLESKWGINYPDNLCAYDSTTTGSGRAYLLNLLNLREASQVEMVRAREGGTPGTVNQFEPVLKVFPDDRPVKVNEYGFDVGASEGFWVVPTN